MSDLDCAGHAGSGTRFRVGVMYDRSKPPEHLPLFCREAEDMGTHDVWVVEDLGWAGSIASAAAALAATHGVRVGIGIAPLPLRNTALLAMELATLARLHPGRLAAGVGHGVSGWMESVGALPRSPLALLEESLLVLRQLLSGETSSLSGKAVSIADVRLVHPPTAIPPVFAGVLRERSLMASGRAADGTILVEGLGPAGIMSARSHIDVGRHTRDAMDRHEIVALTYAYVCDDAAEARLVAEPIRRDQGEFLNVAPDEVFIASGSAADVAAQIKALARAGADCVVLHFLGVDHLGQMRRLMDLLPGS